LYSDTEALNEARTQLRLLYNKLAERYFASVSDGHAGGRGLCTEAVLHHIVQLTADIATLRDQMRNAWGPN
jgi:hypothetical protein